MNTPVNRDDRWTVDNSVSRNINSDLDDSTTFTRNRMSDDNQSSPSQQAINITSTPVVPPVITIHNQTNEEVAKIEIKDNKLEFTGDCNEAAEIFFEYILKNMCDTYIQNSIDKDEYIKEKIEYLQTHYKNVTTNKKNYYVVNI